MWLKDSMTSLSIARMRNVNGHIPLTEQERTSVIGVALRAFGKGMAPDEIERHVIPSTFLYIARAEKGIVGFAALNVENNEGYFGGSAIDSTVQANGIYYRLVEQRLLDMFDLGIT